MNTKPQTYLNTYGERVIVCECETGRVVCGFDMSELLAIAAEKEAQNHTAQHLEMVAQADVPLPEPPAFYRYQFRSNYGLVWRSSSEKWDDFGPIATEGLYTFDQMHQYAKAYAKAVVGQKGAYDEQT